MKQKVQVWIYAKDEPGAWRVLVLKTRADRGGFWQPVTGSVEAGESLETAAAREAREETGLTFKAKPLKLGRPFKYEKNGKQFMETGFEMEAACIGALDERGLPEVKTDPHEHTEYRWLPPEGALKMIQFPSNKDILKALMPKFHQYE